MSDETQRDPAPPVTAAADAAAPAEVSASPPTVPRPTRKATFPGVSATPAPQAPIPPPAPLPRVPGMDGFIAPEASPRAPAAPSSAPMSSRPPPTDDTDHAWTDDPAPPPAIPAMPSPLPVVAAPPVAAAPLIDEAMGLSRPSSPDPPSSAPGSDTSGGVARRKSRRTVKIPDDAVPGHEGPASRPRPWAKPDPSDAPTPPAPAVGMRSSAPPQETPMPAPVAVAAPAVPGPFAMPAPSGPSAAWPLPPPRPPSSSTPEGFGPLPPPRSPAPSVPEGFLAPLPPPRSPSPSVPEGFLAPLPPPRSPSPSVPEGFAAPLPPPRSPPAAPVDVPPPPGWAGVDAITAPVVPPASPITEEAFDAAKTLPGNRTVPEALRMLDTAKTLPDAAKLLAEAAKALEPPRPSAPDNESGVIRPMRIINIGTDSPAPDGVAAPSPPPSSPEIEPEEVELEDEPDTQPSGALLAPQRDSETEIEPIEEIEPERISDVSAQPLKDLPPQPKKPPPPPPKRTSIEPPGSTPAPPVVSGPAVATFTASPAAPATPPPAAPAAPPAAAPVAAAPASSPAPASAPATLEPQRKRQKAWWEELFGDDFTRAMDRIDPRIIRKECDFIEDRLGLEKGAVILDLACGPGSHAVELASRGYSVVGYDLSLSMLARAADEAQERGQKLNFLHGDMREMAFEETFDGVYCWQTSFGYFDDEKNVNVLSRIHRALRKGGLLLLDVINHDYVAPRQPSLVWFEGEGCVCMDEMFVDFFTSRLRVKRTVMFEDGRTREVDYGIRLYALHELGKMLHECGFKVLEVTGHPAHPGVFFGSESPRVIILAERSERSPMMSASTTLTG
jgi:SAM-dependent methyltransferase